MTVALGWMRLSRGWLCFFVPFCWENEKEATLWVFVWLSPSWENPTLGRRKKKKTEREERKTRRWRRRRRRACFFWLLSPHSAAAAFVAPHKTPAGLPQHREKSQFCHVITWPRACSGKRHLTDVVKMLWHLSLSLLLLRSTTHSISACLLTIYDFIFPPLYTHAFLSSAAFDLSVQKCFLKRSSFVPPQSHLFFFFFSSEQRLQRSRSVQFCHISLLPLCVFVPECVSVCRLYVGLLQTGREINYTIASWLYNSCCGVILTVKERPLLSMAGVVGTGLHVQQLPREGLHPPQELVDKCLNSVWHMWHTTLGKYE